MENLSHIRFLTRGMPPGAQQGSAEQMQHWSTRQLINGILLGSTLLIFCVIGVYKIGFIGLNPTYVRTTLAEQRSLNRTVEAFGRVQPLTWVSIRPQFPGEIVALPVEEGTDVKQGELLARLQADGQKTRIAKARAQVKKEKALLSYQQVDSTRARRRYERQKGLSEAGVSYEARKQEAHTHFNRTVAELEEARARVEEAKAELKRRKQEGSHLEIRAPMNGIISQIRVDIGERVHGTGLLPGTQMMRIEQSNRMVLRVSLDESNIPYISTEDTASIRLNAYPDRAFPAKVTSIAWTRYSKDSERLSAQLPTATPPSLFTLDAGYPVRLQILCKDTEDPSPTMEADLDRTCPRLRTGMGGTARIPVATADSAVAVPRSAITFRHTPVRETPVDTTAARPFRSRQKVAFVVDHGVARRRIVTTGLQTDSHVDVCNGLRPGAEVIIGPEDAVQRRLSDGQPVEVGRVSSFANRN